MSISSPNGESSTGKHQPPSSSYNPASTVTPTREKAIDEYDFEKLVDASYSLDHAQDIEARFILFVAGRLGLRRGELTHFDESWIDWRKRRIDIPEQQTCEKGRNGGPCGHCRQMARQQTEHALASAAEASALYHSDVADANARGEVELERELEKAAERVRLPVSSILEFAGETTVYETAYDNLYRVHYDDLLEQVLDDQWTAKTVNAARQVPFSWCGRAEIVLERYFDEWSQWMYTGNAINRRLAWLCESVPDVDVTPHALRGTAATHLAGKGLDVLQMTNMFGWSQLSTARSYIASSSDQLDTQLKFLLS